MFSHTVVPISVARVCDHSETVQVSYKYAREKNDILRYARMQFCTSCAADIKQWFDNPSSDIFSVALRPLTGTEKQVKWATSIRASRFKTLLQVMNSAACSPGKAGLGIWWAILAFSMQTSAKFWIDTRDLPFDHRYFMLEASYFLKSSALYGVTFNPSSVFGEWKARTPYLIEKVKSCYPAPDGQPGASEGGAAARTA